ncbi:hypothetical protein R1flu_017602 [Riccia fluitans]|uniref:Uncharacterized protein n=1 Tax=Riccia fluitans TaxID=41844 RepID=A0ABD1ZHG0_9MARC
MWVPQGRAVGSARSGQDRSIGPRGRGMAAARSRRGAVFLHGHNGVEAWASWDRGMMMHFPAGTMASECRGLSCI